MTWFKRKTNEGSNPSQSVKFDPLIEAAKEVIRNTYTPVSMYPMVNIKTWSTNTTSSVFNTGALERLRNYLEENGVEWRRCFDRDAIIFTMPSGDEVMVDGFIFVQADNEQLIVDYIMRQLDQFAE